MKKIDNRKETGKKIRLARAQAKLSQSQLAKILGRTGASIAYFEQGKRSVSAETLSEIANATDKPIAYFFGRDKMAMDDINQLLKLGKQIDCIRRVIDRTENKSRAMMEGSPDFVFVSRIDNFKFVDVNQRACDYYGYSRNEFLNMNIFDIEVKPMLKKEVRQLYANTPVGKVLEVNGVNKKKDGTEFAVNVRFTKLDGELALANVRSL